MEKIKKTNIFLLNLIKCFIAALFLFILLSLFIKTSILADPGDPHGCNGMEESWCEMCKECIGPGNAPKTCSPPWCGNPPQQCPCTAPSAPTIISPADGTSGLNPDGLRVEWTMGEWGADSGNVPGCYNTPGNDYFVLYFRKTTGGISDTPPSAPPGSISGGWNYEVLSGTLRNYTLYNLDGGSTYEIVLAVSNGCGSNNGAIITVNTELRPRIDSLTASTVCPADGTGVFWSGEVGANSSITNPANYRTVFSDPDGASNLSYAMLQIDATANDPSVSNYKYLRVMYVQTKEGYLDNTFYLWDNNQWKSPSDGAIDGTYAKVYISENESRASQSGNTLTVDWKIEFKHAFQNGKHNFYAYIEDQAGAQDRRSGTVTTTNVGPSLPVGNNWHQMPGFANWGVDTDVPSLTLPVPSIVDANTIDIPWSGSDSMSGLRKIDGFCWQSGGAATNITKVLPPPIQTKKLDTSDPDPNNLPDITSNCFASLTVNRTIRYDLSQAVGDITAYNFKSKVIDNACNIGTNTQSQATNSPWILTYGNNLHTGDFPITIPYISIDSLFAGSGGTILARTSGGAFASTYIDSSIGTTIPLRASSNSYTKTTYNDLNINPPVKADRDNYYEYLYDIVSSNTTITTIPSSAFTGKTSMSTVGAVPANTFTSYLVQGDLSIADPTTPRLFTCDTKTILFVSGNLTVDPDFTVSGNNNGCIIIVRGNITITNGDYKNVGNTNINVPARYDRVEAFLIANGTLTSQEDIIGNFKWDGLLIKGTVITQGIDLQRDLRLLNNISGPAEGIVFDPRYISIEEFRDAFSIGGFSLREVGFDK